MKEELEYRMYFLTMRNISEIQKGIQCGHAAIEYSLKYQDNPIYQEWAKNHKTFIILNGGVSNNGSSYLLGTMETYLLMLEEKGIRLAVFKEPDLNWSLSAIAFILDERVFNKKKYPDYHIWLKEECDLETWSIYAMDKTCSYYQDWVKFIGGEKNVWLREFKSQFNLA